MAQVIFVRSREPQMPSKPIFQQMSGESARVKAIIWEKTFWHCRRESILDSAAIKKDFLAAMAVAKEAQRIHNGICSAINGFGPNITVQPEAHASEEQHSGIMQARKALSEACQALSDQPYTFVEEGSPGIHFYEKGKHFGIPFNEMTCEALTRLKDHRLMLLPSQEDIAALKEFISTGDFQTLKEQSRSAAALLEFIIGIKFADLGMPADELATMAGSGSPVHQTLIDRAKRIYAYEIGTCRQKVFLR